MSDIGIVLGASAWPKTGAQYFSSAGFGVVASRWRAFQRSRGVAEDDLLWLFDDEEDAATQLRRARQFLIERSSRSGVSALWVYYVGHGTFLGPDQRYSLLVRGTEEGLEDMTSIAFSSFAEILRRHASTIPKILVLDCCFASAATREFLGSVEHAITRKAEEAFPEGGTALLCAASAKSLALGSTDDSGTVFSTALLDVVEEGSSHAGPLLTLRQLHELTWERIMRRHGTGSVRPQLHVSNQNHDDIGNVPLIVNHAYKVERSTRLEVSPLMIDLGTIADDEVLPPEYISITGSNDLGSWGVDTSHDWVRIEDDGQRLILRLSPPAGANRANVYVRDLVTGAVHTVRLVVRVVATGASSALPEDPTPLTAVRGRGQSRSITSGSSILALLAKVLLVGGILALPSSRDRSSNASLGAAVQQEVGEGEERQPETGSTSTTLPATTTTTTTSTTLPIESSEVVRATLPTVPVTSIPDTTIPEPTTLPTITIPGGDPTTTSPTSTITLPG